MRQMNPYAPESPALAVEGIETSHSTLCHDRERSILRLAARVRAFEMKLLDLFREGLISGTVHTCVGQEICATALHPHLRPGVDAFFATHRGHGHYLAHGGPEDALFAELMGRDGALCLGRGGTQNLRFKRFYSAGIQGGSAPIATGFAYAMARRGENSIAVVQIGDGTLGEGTLYEAFTFAAWLNAPVLFLVEFNGWAQSTDVSRTTPGDICTRAEGFGIRAHRISDSDPAALSEHLREVVEIVRRGEPFVQVIDTRRLLAHSKGDDDRSRELIARLWNEDPLARALSTDSDLQQFSQEAQQELSSTAKMVADRPLLASVDGPALLPPTTPCSGRDLGFREHPPTENLRVVERLNSALHELMASNSDVVLIGEDLLDPYGGAFKVAKGLSTRFPRQVLSTPIAEAAIVGASNGMALAGLRPIVEIMFGDFITLAADQLINFSAKFHFMYGQVVPCPLTIRVVSGGGRGYGPTHSQSLERLFCGVPGLRVVALSQRHDPHALLRRVVLESDCPTIFVENKLLYSLRPTATAPLDLRSTALDETCVDFPPLCYQPLDESTADVTVVTYGGMTSVAEVAMHDMVAEDELRFDYFVLTQLWPLRLDPIVASARRTGRLVVVEENVADFGVAAAVLSAVSQEVRSLACRAVGCLPVPLPAVRHLEDLVLPSAEAVKRAIRDVL